MVAGPTPSGSALGVRTDSLSVIPASALLPTLLLTLLLTLFPGQPNRAPARVTAVTVCVELTFEAVQHVERRRYACLRRDFGGADRAVARAAQKHHRPLTVAGGDLVLQFGEELVVVLPV